MKWNIKNKNVKDVSNVNYEKEIKKAKWLKVINIICYICTGILFIFFIIGGVKSCDKKESNNPSQHNAPTIKYLEYDHNNDNFIFYYNDFVNLSLNDEIVSAFGDFNVGINGNLYYDGDEYEFLEYIVGYQSSNQKYYIEYRNENDNYVIQVIYNGGISPNLEGHLLYSFDEIYIELDGEILDLSTDDNAYLYFSIDDDYDFDNSDYYEVVSPFFTVGLPYDEELFDAITDTVSNFIVTLGSGVNALLVLFYANSQLTVLGTITVIVVGVAFVYFLMRFIFGLIRLRG